MTELANLLWNAHANHPSQGRRVVEKLDRWAHDHRIQVGVLTEVKGAYPHLRSWCRTNGFVIGQERGTTNPADERGDTALLLRVKGRGALDVDRQWPAVMEEDWEVFDHDQRHNPRRHRRATFRTPDETRIRYAGDHWPTRGNKRAWEESRNAAASFLNGPGISILGGDVNSDWEEARELAQLVGGTVKGDGPDYLFVNRTADLEVRNLGAGGSDHDALVVTVAL